MKGMLQSSILEPLLTQMLIEHHEITPLTPLSVAFVSKGSHRSLVTYTAKHQLTPTVQATADETGYALEQHEGYMQLAPNEDVTIQGQITHLNNLQYEDDYINTDANPQSMLNVLGLSVIKEWCTFLSTAEASQLSETQVYEHGQFLFYIHNVNDLYAVMVICQREYPSELCIGKLDNLCTLLSKKLASS